MIPKDPDFYKELLDQMSDGVYFVDRHRRILYWNQGAFRLSGYSAEEIVGQCCQDEILCHVDYEGRNLCQTGCPLLTSMHDGGEHTARLLLRHKQGRRVPVSVKVQPIRAEDGTVVGAIEIFADDSARVEAGRRSQEMKRLAFLDHLTQLPNRRFVEMSLGSALGEYQVHKDPFGILLFDFDNFKAINDSFGHACGDRALQEGARTLHASLRPGDIVGRWGGDEFLAIVRNINAETLTRLAERCIALVAQTAVPINDGERISLSISAGAALVHPDESAEELIHRADELMYQSKNSGRARATIE